jgi:ribosomal protein S4E
VVQKTERIPPHVGITKWFLYFYFMGNETKLKDGDECTVTAGTHSGKSGTVRDINTSKTGHITITVEQKNGIRFKTLGKNVMVTK